MTGCVRADCLLHSSALCLQNQAHTKSPPLSSVGLSAHLSVLFRKGPQQLPRRCVAILTHVLASFLLCGERGVSRFLLNIFHMAFICFSETELHSEAQAGFKVQSPCLCHPCAGTAGCTTSAGFLIKLILHIKGMDGVLRPRRGIISASSVWVLHRSVNGQSAERASAAYAS